jgi:hypothetical protein
VKDHVHNLLEKLALPRCTQARDSADARHTAYASAMRRRAEPFSSRRRGRCSSPFAEFLAFGARINSTAGLCFQSRRARWPRPVGRDRPDPS